MPILLHKVSDQDKNFFERLLKRAEQIDSGNFTPPLEFRNKSLGMIFFEPSSRTNWSFHKASIDMGLKVMSTYVDSSSSLSKGESLADSLSLFLNLDFDIVVMRSKEDQTLLNLIQSHKSDTHFINAGFGSDAHPTQALLDFYTWSKYTDLTSSPNILIMGDLRHSRVVRSHLRLARILGYNVGLCPLENLSLPEGELEELSPAKVFKSREEAIDWADILMPLRAQKERFQEGGLNHYKAYPLKSEELSKKHWLMHPGPIVWGEDLDPELMQYPKSLISHQQKSGLTCRAALISLMLEEN